MADKVEATTEEMTVEEKRQHVEFVANAIRSGLFSTAQDILNDLNKRGTAHAATATMTGAAMFVAELVQGTMAGMGGDLGNAKKWLLESVGAYFDAYCEEMVREKASRIVNGEPTVQ
jgi:hypothetical protein